MPNQAVKPLVKRTLEVVATPAHPLLTKVMLIPADAFFVLSRFGRKFRLFSKPQNCLPLFAGTVLEAAAGRIPTLQQIARVVFGSVCIIKCSEDLLRLADSASAIKKIFQDRSYVYIKQKSWEALTYTADQSPSKLYFAKLRKIENKILIRRFFYCLAEIFRSIALFALHFSDACTAYRENTLSEVFVHSKDLFEKLTSDEAPIVKHLNRYRKVNDMMMAGLGLSWTTTALVGVITLPATVRKNAPGFEELVQNFRDNFATVGEKIDAFKELISIGYLEAITRAKLLNLLPQEVLPKIDRKYEFYEEGVDDPDTLRYFESPKRIPLKIPNYRQSSSF